MAAVLGILLAPFLASAQVPPPLPAGAPTQLKCNFDISVIHQVPLANSSQTRSVSYIASSQQSFPISGDYVFVNSNDYYYYRFANQSVDLKALIEKTTLSIDPTDVDPDEPAPATLQVQAANQTVQATVGFGGTIDSVLPSGDPLQTLLRGAGNVRLESTIDGVHTASNHFSLREDQLSAPGIGGPNDTSAFTTEATEELYLTTTAGETLLTFVSCRQSL